MMSPLLAVVVRSPLELRLRLQSRLLLLLLLLPAACSRSPWRPATNAGPRKIEVMRGMLHELRPGRLTFEPCGVNMHLDVEHRSGGALAAARAKHPPVATTPLFVELRIERGVRTDDWRTEADWRVVVIEVLGYAAVDKATGCASAPVVP